MELIMQEPIHTPWSRCTARAPPLYDLSPKDHVQVCAPGSSTRPPCHNNATGHKDFGLGVQTGAVAPEFTLPLTADPSKSISLSDLLESSPYVLLQFGAYT